MSRAGVEERVPLLKLSERDSQVKETRATTEGWRFEAQDSHRFRHAAGNGIGEREVESCIYFVASSI